MQAYLLFQSSLNLIDKQIQVFELPTAIIAIVFVLGMKGNMMIPLNMGWLLGGRVKKADEEITFYCFREQ